MQSLLRDAFRYTPFFCEENIWWLAHDLGEQDWDIDRLTVLVFSNPWHNIVLFKQRGADHSMPVVWDYHVVLSARFDQADWIFDFDTRLLFPMPRADYLRATFPAQDRLPEQLRSAVRTIPAASYLRHFYSDRAHMQGVVERDRWPAYPIIQPAAHSERIALSDYWDMHKTLDDGSWVDSVAHLLDPARPSP